MVDWLTGLMLRHPGVATVPVVAFLLFLCFTLYAVGFRRVPYFWPGQLGVILRVCYQVGLSLLMILCLLGCVYFGMQTSLARQPSFVSLFCWQFWSSVGSLSWSLACSETRTGDGRRGNPGQKRV